MGSKKFKPDAGIDKGNINELLKNIPSDLLTSLFSKYNLLDFKSNDELLNIKVEIVNANIHKQKLFKIFPRDRPVSMVSKRC
jgi:hypothetical protein